MNHNTAEDRDKIAVLLEREKTAKIICAELNDFVDLKSALISVMSNIKRIAGCEAIGIRLHHDEDYPYYVYEGFPENFIMKENSLCVRHENGCFLACMCGYVISGKFDPSLSFFTDQGSFCSNETSSLPSCKAEEEWLSDSRGTCISCGYESVALIPIKSKGRIVGLIQLNDKRKNMFTEDLIDYMEMIGEHIGLAVENSLIHTRLKEEEKIIGLKQEVERLKAEFFTNVSHELSTPLTVILSAVQLLALYINTPLRMNNIEKANRHLNAMKRNCYRLIRTVNNLLDITKIDLGYFEINRVNVNLVDIVEMITSSVRDYIGSKGLTLEFIKNAEKIFTACDPEKIEKVLFNLLSNAVKFSKPGGKISVSVFEEQGNAVISVKDTGIGIPEDMLDTIFERFKQAENLLTREHEGCGIGLALAKSIVEMHGGTITVNSREGIGSKFTISLPVEILADIGFAQQKPDSSIIRQSRVEGLNVELLGL